MSKGHRKGKKNQRRKKAGSGNRKKTAESKPVVKPDVSVDSSNSNPVVPEKSIEKEVKHIDEVCDPNQSPSAESGKPEGSTEPDVSHNVALENAEGTIKSEPEKQKIEESKSLKPVADAGKPIETAKAGAKEKKKLTIQQPHVEEEKQEEKVVPEVKKEADIQEPVQESVPSLPVAESDIQKGQEQSAPVSEDETEEYKEDVNPGQRNVESEQETKNESKDQPTDSGFPWDDDTNVEQMPWEQDEIEKIDTNQKTDPVEVNEPSPAVMPSSIEPSSIEPSSGEIPNKSEAKIEEAEEKSEQKTSTQEETQKLSKPFSPSHQKQPSFGFLEEDNELLLDDVMDGDLLEEDEDTANVGASQPKVQYNRPMSVVSDYDERPVSPKMQRYIPENRASSPPLGGTQPVTRVRSSYVPRSISRQGAVSPVSVQRRQWQPRPSNPVSAPPQQPSKDNQKLVKELKEQMHKSDAYDFPDDMLAKYSPVLRAKTPTRSIYTEIERRRSSVSSLASSRSGAISPLPPAKMNMPGIPEMHRTNKPVSRPVSRPASRTPGSQYTPQQGRPAVPQYAKKQAPSVPRATTKPSFFAELPVTPKNIIKSPAVRNPYAQVTATHKEMHQPSLLQTPGNKFGTPPHQGKVRSRGSTNPYAPSGVGAHVRAPSIAKNPEPVSPNVVPVPPRLSLNGAQNSQPAPSSQSTFQAKSPYAPNSYKSNAYAQNAYMPQQQSQQQPQQQQQKQQPQQQPQAPTFGTYQEQAQSPAQQYIPARVHGHSVAHRHAARPSIDLLYGEPHADTTGPNGPGRRRTRTRSGAAPPPLLTKGATLSAVGASSNSAVTSASPSAPAPVVVNPENLVRRQWPLFSFARGSALVSSMIPNSDGYGHRIANIATLPISAHLSTKAHAIFELSASFPGPLNPAGTNKCTELSTWLKRRLDVEIRNFSSQSQYAPDQPQDDLLTTPDQKIWALLKLMVDQVHQPGDMFTKRTYLDAAVKIINPVSSVGAAGANCLDPVSLQRTATTTQQSTEHTTLDANELTRVYGFLQQGRTREAIEYAVSAGDWALAITLSSLLGTQAVSQILHAFADHHFSVQDPLMQTLRFVSSLGADSIAQASDATAPGSTPLSASAVGTISGASPAWIAENFNSIIPLIMSCMEHPAILLCRLAQTLDSRPGYHAYAIICVLLSGLPSSKIGDKSMEAFCSEDSTIVREIYLYILLSTHSIPQGLVAKVTSSQLIPTQLERAGQLADEGHYSVAEKYLECMRSEVRSSAVSDPATLLEYGRLMDRIHRSRETDAGRASDAPGWFGGKLGKPNINRVWSQLDKSFNKFVAGESLTSRTDPKGATSDVFSNFSTPVASRSPSLLDLPSQARQAHIPVEGAGRRFSGLTGAAQHHNPYMPYEGGDMSSNASPVPQQGNFSAVSSPVPPASAQIYSPYGTTQAAKPANQSYLPAASKNSTNVKIPSAQNVNKAVSNAVKVDTHSQAPPRITPPVKKKLSSPQATKSSEQTKKPVSLSNPPALRSQMPKLAQGPIQPVPTVAHKPSSTLPRVVTPPMNKIPSDPVSQMLESEQKLASPKRKVISPPNLMKPEHVKDENLTESALSDITLPSPLDVKVPTKGVKSEVKSQQKTVGKVDLSKKPLEKPSDAKLTAAIVSLGSGDSDSKTTEQTLKTTDAASSQSTILPPKNTELPPKGNELSPNSIESAKQSNLPPKLPTEPPPKELIKASEGLTESQPSQSTSASEEVHSPPNPYAPHIASKKPSIASPYAAIYNRARKMSQQVESQQLESTGEIHKNAYEPPENKVDMKAVKLNDMGIPEDMGSVDIYGFGGYHVPPPVKQGPTEQESTELENEGTTEENETSASVRSLNSKVDNSSDLPPPTDNIINPAAHLRNVFSPPRTPIRSRRSSYASRRSSVGTSFATNDSVTSDMKRSAIYTITEGKRLYANEADETYDDDVVDSSSDDEDEDTQRKLENERKQREERERKKREEKKRLDEQKKKQQKEQDRKKKGKHKKGWLSWLSHKDEGPKPIKARLGEENHFYYDEKLKRWINKDVSVEEQTVSTPAPPPMLKKATASGSASTGFSMHPPPEPNTPLRAPTPPVAMSSPAVSPPFKKKGGDTIDDLLSMSSGARRRGKRRGRGRGYVDVMALQSKK